MDTRISDPSCMRASAALSYYSSPTRPDFYRLEAYFVVQTGKPLTLKDVIAQTWTDAKWIDKMTSAKIYDDSGWSDQDEHVNLVPEHEYDENHEILELDSLADIIEQLEIDHECKAVFKPEHTVIYLVDNSETNTGPFTLIPTESESRDVIDHDEDAYAALLLTIDSDKKEWEAESKKNRQPMSQKQLESLFLRLQQGREG